MEIVDNDSHREVEACIADAFHDEDIEELCKLIPSLKKLAPAGETKVREDLFKNCEAVAAKNRLHRLFGLLVKALSNQSKPLLLIIDYLQWADINSLELLANGIMSAAGPQLLLFGSYRSNEVADSDPLVTSIQQMKDRSTLVVEEVPLEGLSNDDVNDLISDSLFYPRRLTRSLANLIHQKSAGSPLFVKEFLNSLATENLLRYSLSQHKWIFDEEVIMLKTVSDGVVDLLTKRLRRLSRGVLSALIIMSCLGSEVSSEVLQLVKSTPYNSNIFAALDVATSEFLLKKDDSGSYSFVHDMIHQAVYQGVNPKGRSEMMKKLADSLIASTTNERSDAILFIIVDLIKRVGPDIVISVKDRVRYAELHLHAGEKSIKTPDYASASVYLESGITFLDESRWTNNYKLSLQLFNGAALVHWALGDTILMKRRIDEVCLWRLCVSQECQTIAHPFYLSRFLPMRSPTMINSTQ
jgi:ATP-dependent RNA helicase DDX31/DBP7